MPVKADEKDALNEHAVEVDNREELL